MLLLNRLLIYECKLFFIVLKRKALKAYWVILNKMGSIAKNPILANETMVQ